MPSVHGKRILVKRFKVEPEVAWQEIERVRHQNGGLAAPQAIVDAARPEDSPLHPAFEWDDAKAAEGYRKQQARALVRCFELVFEDGKRAPAMVSVRVDDRRGYMPTQEAREVPDLRSQMLRDAFQRFLALEARFKTLHELSGVYQLVRQQASDLGFEDLIDEAA